MAPTAVATVARNVLHFSGFRGAVHPKAVRIFTPLTSRVPLSSCKVSQTLGQFIASYEPKTKTDGLFPHQAAFFKEYTKGRDKDYIITTATGSGKSLCFWAWTFDRLRRDSHATALLCFPTQALMWAQAERLARLSDKQSLAKPDRRTSYAGAVAIGEERIGWTIWHGTGTGATRDPVMAEHEKTDTFKHARIRIATLDKAHWSLFRSRKNQAFASHLRCFVLDEAHSYDGVFGANVHYFLKRLYLASEIQGQNRPRLFLASATLAAAPKFAATLLSLDEKQIVHIKDSTKQQIDLIDTDDVPGVLSKPPDNGLLRIVMLLNSGQKEGLTLSRFMGSGKGLGTHVNAVYFSESKYHSKWLKLMLEKKCINRSYVVYDADLPPPKRRQLERRLNEPAVQGTTVLATRALELGVDIEGLDVCFIDKIPSNRADLLQRIGRVGRRGDRPGLAVLRLSAEPHDQQILEDARAAFRLDLSRPLPIPLHLDMLRWKHALAAFMEWIKVLSCRDVGWPEFNRALKQYFRFDPVPTYKELKEQFTELYGALADMDDGKFWVYHGFRATAGKGKVPLKEDDREIARIEDIAVFRDAHPEAIYLGHDGNRYRVGRYIEGWKIAQWEDPKSDALLGKWLRSLKCVQVKRERRRLTTRGAWQDEFRLYEVQPVSQDRHGPMKGRFEFGIWDYVRKWKGYTEINLDTGERRRVTLAEVTERFAQAMQRGERFPFLHNFSYRTVGWQWGFNRINAACQQPLGSLVGSILEHFLAAAVESRVEDFGVQLDLPGHQLQVLDATPGGNGLSEALLAEGRMPTALSNCLKALSKHKGKKAFDKYVVALCHEKPSHSAKEVTRVIRELHLHWAG